MTNRLLVTAIAASAAWVIAAESQAQPLGTFTWQLQPFCNVVAINVTQQGAVYTMDGYDDQCGAARRAPIVGLGTPNPDGSIGLGWNIVTTPGGRGVQVDARITLPSASGSWSDSAGNTGTLALGASTGGNARPLPATAAAIPGAFSLRTDGGFLAGGALQAGSIPASGAGTRMMWFPGKAAFRVGQVGANQWDNANVGEGSVAMGASTLASGNYSTALGSGTSASGPFSTALGYQTTASGTISTAMGNNSMASGLNSTAMGAYTVASGAQGTALGYQTTASGVSSIAMGSVTQAEGLVTTVMGTYARATAAAPGSFVYGDRSTANAGAGVVTSVSPNQFLVRAAGGTVFWSTAQTNFPTSPGVILVSGDSQWSSLSDVNSKENFLDVAGEHLLARLAAMPVREWNYKAQDAAIRHLGPTAQDFHAAFGLGADPRRIGTVDADGIALAAVKALEIRTRELPGDSRALREQIAALGRENDDLRARLARLEALLDQK